MDFGLYCDLQNELVQNKSKNDIQFWAMRFVEGDDENDIFLQLINECDEEKIKKLIDYFEPDAPVQKILQNKLKEIKSKETIEEDNYDEYRKIVKTKTSFYLYLVDVMRSK